MEQAPALATLLGAYYHQDWDIHGPGEFDPLDAFLQDTTAARALVLADEVDALLASVSDDSDLDRYLDKEGCALYLGEDPSAYRDWFREVAARSRAYAAASGA